MPVGTYFFPFANPPALQVSYEQNGPPFMGPTSTRLQGAARAELGNLSASAPELLDLHPASLGHLAAGVGLGSSVSAVTGPAVFLHTGWRSGGTWIWSRCRDYAHVHGYYEPLHEQAAQFRRRDVARMRPGSWQSNHSATAPYFEEYRDLIPSGGRGVPLYQSRFAFDGFFRAPDDPPDPELQAYLRSLLLSPLAAGRVPVLKFCRSLGRVGWLEQLFPQALHAVVLRDPVSQFASTQRLLLEQRNRYFALAPLLVLARNAHVPAVREAALALGVTIPALYSDDMDYAVETSWRHVRRASPDERYRGFLAFWTLCAIYALESDALVIDTDLLAEDLGHRRSAEQALFGVIGETISLAPRPARAAQDAWIGETMWCAEAHRAAESLVFANRARLTPERMAVILAKLELGFAPSGQIRAARSWRTPVLPPPMAPQGAGQRIATCAAVRLARAMQPLRRLHGAMVWRSKGEKIPGDP